MASYRFYTNTFQIGTEDPIDYDLDGDLDTDRHNCIISCDKGTILVEFLFDQREGFGDAIEFTSSDGILNVPKVKHVRISPNAANSSYKIIAGLS